MTIEESGPFQTAKWHIDTRYYSCQASFVSTESVSDAIELCKVEGIDALVVVVDSERIFEQLKEWEELMDSLNVPQTVMVVFNGREADEEASEALLGWSIEHGAEFIDIHDAEEDDDEELGGFKEKFGVDRIIEALQTHAWTEMTVKDSDVPSATDVSTMRDFLFDGNNEDEDGLDSALEKLQNLRLQAQGLSDTERRNLAAKVALAFLGSDDEEEEEEVHR